MYGYLVWFRWEGRMGSKVMIIGKIGLRKVLEIVVPKFQGIVK